MGKYELTNSMFEGIPEGVREMIGKKFGTFRELSEPTTEEEANIVIGKMCADVQNHMLRPLSGLPVVDTLLYIGSLAPPLISGLFSGLEALEGGGPFDVIAPKNGGTYPGFFDAWTVRAGQEIEEISVTVGTGEEAETFDLSRNDDVFTAKFPMPIGEHSATFTDGTQSVSVSFSVVSWETYPAEGGTYKASDLSTVSIKVPGMETVESVNASLLGRSVELVYQSGDLWVAENLNFDSIGIGAETATFLVQPSDSGAIQVVVDFDVESI